MPQDAFTLRRVVAQLHPDLVGSKITKIIQPDKDALLFYLYTQRGGFKLLLSTNASDARISFTTYDYPAPAVAPNFCMLLRKYLLGATITEVEQIGFERVIAISLHCVSDFTEADRVLYLEVMGKYSNLILTEHGQILGALKMTALEENYKRVLFAGVPYTLPAPQDKADPTKDLSVLSSYTGGDLAEFLFLHVAGIARPTAEDIARTWEGDLETHVRNYLFESETAPCILIRDGKIKDFFAREVPFSTPVSSLSEAQDRLYTQRETDKAFDTKRRKLLSAVRAHKKKEEKKLALLLDRLRECADAEDNKKYGELITANIYAIGKGAKSCRVTDYYDETCPTITIRLDETLTPAQNAQKYYKKYNKQKRTVCAVTPQKEETEQELDYAESLVSSIERAETAIDLTEIEEELYDTGLLKFQGKKRKEVVTPFRTYEKDGFKILSGRNNKQNDRLLKSMRAGDIWLHTQKYHSSHVAILSEGREVPDGVLLVAAQICAYYSDGNKGGKVAVDYCDRRFVKKPPKANAGFVVYTNYSTLLVEPNLPE
ncbi:MAG: NFACT family protein [Clostridia bacterium]|nr:NFACT family protein [Clostridia bacterium]